MGRLAFEEGRRLNTNFQLIAESLDSAAVRIARALPAGVSPRGFTSADYQRVVDLLTDVTQIRDTYRKLATTGKPRPEPPTEPEEPETGTGT